MGPPLVPRRVLLPGKGLREPGDRQASRERALPKSGCLATDGCELPAPPSSPPAAAATVAFPSSDCWMTALSLVGLELAAQTGHRGWRRGGREGWERGRSALGRRSGDPALPPPAPRAAQQHQQPQPQEPQQREREAGSAAAESRGRRRLSLAELSRARSRTAAAAAWQMPSQQQRAR